MIYQYLALLLIHWMADFIAQTHWQASNKSKDNVALSKHVLNYTCILTITSLFIFQNSSLVIVFGFLNGIFHFGTDYITSRITSKLYTKQDYHNFFVIIGLDQLIHQITLAATMIWILS